MLLPTTGGSIALMVRARVRARVAVTGCLHVDLSLADTEALTAAKYLHELPAR